MARSERQRHRSVRQEAPHLLEVAQGLARGALAAKPGAQRSGQGRSVEQTDQPFAGDQEQTRAGIVEDAEDEEQDRAPAW